MVSKFQWKPFWLATQRDPQNDWTATQNRVNYDVFAQAPLVQGATRNPLGAAVAQLDLMFLNDISSVEACVVLPQLSDQCPTLLSLNIQPPKQQVARRSFLDFKHADFCGLNRCLAELDWSPVLDVDNPDTAAQIWNEILSVAMHKFIPEKQACTRSQNRPWYSLHLCRIRRQRDRLYTR